MCAGCDGLVAGRERGVAVAGETLSGRTIASARVIIVIVVMSVVAVVFVVVCVVGCVGFCFED